MEYTINKLATLSGVTVRTLRFYDKIGLLKPAYVADNGYRYYQEKQLLLLQQILFFKELGFELKQIQEILKQDDFDKVHALESHKKVMKKNIERFKTLLKTIDTTIDHLKGKITMNAQEMFEGFDREQQAYYEKELVERFGKPMEDKIAESYTRLKHWTKADWDVCGTEFSAMCIELVQLLNKKALPSDPRVQAIMARYYTWLSNFDDQSYESFIGIGQGYTQPAWEKTFDPYDPKLAQFLADAMKIYADKELR